jgi:hypothetical protein
VAELLRSSLSTVIEVDEIALRVVQEADPETGDASPETIASLMDVTIQMIYMILNPPTRISVLMTPVSAAETDEVISITGRTNTRGGKPSSTIANHPTTSMSPGLHAQPCKVVMQFLKSHDHPLDHNTIKSRLHTKLAYKMQMLSTTLLRRLKPIVN